jgi:hypothetical protein
MPNVPPARPSFDDQERLYPAIAAALLKSVPGDWYDIRMRIEAVDSQCQFEISGPGGVPNLRVPDDSLYALAIELYDLFVRDSCPFSRCDFRLNWDDAAEKWRYTADFAYPAKA